LEIPDNLLSQKKSLDEMTEVEIFDNLLEKLNIQNKENLKNTFNELLSYIE
jgi:hypothetical protein